MLGSRSIDTSSNSDQNNDVSFKGTHCSSSQIENNSISQFSHPPFVFHDPTAQSLEESYLVSSILKPKFYSFFMFA